MIDFSDALRWRYRVYVEPRFALHHNPWFALKRLVANARAASAERPLVYVYANPQNTGDYASYLGLTRLVGRPGLQLFCARAAVPATMRILQEQLASGGGWGGVFVGGGGLLQECFDPFWEALVSSSVPFVLFGVGAAEELPQRRLTSPGLLRAIADRAHAVHVRDRFTQQLFASVQRHDVTIGVCPAMQWIREAAQSIDTSDTRLLHVIHDADLAMAGIAEDALRDRVRRIAGTLGLRYEESRHMGSWSRRLLKQYARAAIVVSSRLHGCIFSYAMGKPHVAIRCDNKIGWFHETFETNMPMLDAAEWRDGLTAERVEAARHREPAPHLEDYLISNHKRMRDILASLPKGTDARETETLPSGALG